VEAVKGRDLKLERRALVRQKARLLYVRHCATCHGDPGDGRGENAPFCEEAPRDFRRGEFKLRTTPSGKLARLDDLYRTISAGIPGTDMPPWSGKLSPEERRLLAEYVTTFSPRYLNEDPPAPIEIPKEPPADRASIDRGQALFVKLQCPQCHGVSGRGDGVSKEMLDDTKHRVIALDLSRPMFKGGRGAPAVFRAISTGLSGSPMPSFFDLATANERWDLAHYVESLSGERSLFDYLFRDPAGRRTAY
jgi:mono/diheme cytochrome c family protein